MELVRKETWHNLESIVKKQEIYNEIDPPIRRSSNPISIYGIDRENELDHQILQLDSSIYISGFLVWKE
ncbi:hypothetical protein AXF42_Ash016635 [Apostasia shenzhenica]|uniref:Uncharacterized protein n=1 Tax=Apostasia shenzhenica TaxID=1088818 RepID=A0A2I0A1N3_9ASPA|nr:hypothetical protein AXF42_Ash016635 [Apostasia shenzhenica]